MTLKATARVRVTVEIDLTQPWGKECTMYQIDKQAMEEAMEYLARIPHGRLRVVGPPEVTAVLVREKD